LWETVGFLGFGWRGGLSTRALIDALSVPLTTAPDVAAGAPDAAISPAIAMPEQPL